MKSGWLGGVAACAILCAFANTAMAEDVAATAEAATAATTDELVVFGHGSTREVQAITAQELEKVAPGTSPIKAIQKLPGVNFQSSDAFGAYEWSTRISIRGFNQNQLGFTLDGVPLGDMTYGNVNGLHVSRAVISENLGTVQLSQGAGALSTASSSNLGGTVEFFTRDPLNEFNVNLQGTGGSDSMYRGFIRLDSGELPGGGKGFVSYANQKTDKWKGWGEQKQQQVNVKFVQPVGEGTVTAYYNWSKRRENDYQDMSMEMINRLGYNWDNISNNYALANQVADTALAHYLATGHSGDPSTCVSDPGDGTNVYPAPIKCDDDAYYDAGGLRNDNLWYVNGKTPIGENLKVSGTVYGHTNRGQGSWFAPLNPSPNFGVPGATTDNSSMSFRTTEYDIDRKGVFGDAELTLGDHTIKAGGWYEDNDFNQARRYYALDRDHANRDALEFQSDPYKTRWDYAFNTKTTMLYIEDSWRVMQDLRLNFGFKSLKATNKADLVDGYDTSVAKGGEIEAKDNFLPQVGFNWTLPGAGMGEVFGDYAENMRAFQAAATSGPFSTTQAGFDAIKDSLKPETSKTFELGYRFRIDAFQAQITAYHVKFENRQLATTVGSGVAGNPAVLSNVGSVTTKGVEAAGAWVITPDWSLFASYAYNDSKYDDDVLDGSGALVARTADKTVVDTPKSLANVELSYNHEGWFGSFAAHYTGKRYYTYTNDESVPSYVVADLVGGYRFEGDGWRKGLEIQVNVTNLFDKKYVATVGSNGFVNSGDNLQTLLIGAPRQWFVTVRKDF